MVAVGRYRVRRMKKQHGMRARRRRKFVYTTDSRHDLPPAANLLDRRFNPCGPDQAWVAGITYIRRARLAVSGRRAGPVLTQGRGLWAMAPNMPAELMCTALQMAIILRQPKPGLIMHNDRCSQYASQAHRDLLARHGLIASMNLKGNCWDNAVMERFFLNLKMERVWQRHYANPAEAVVDITHYIVGLYNTHRPV